MDGRLLSIEPSVGWRVWVCELQNGSPKLASIFYPEYWNYEVRAHARCGGGLVREAEHPSPDPGCECGIWATHELEHALTYAPKWLGSPSLIRRHTTFIVGRVELTGRVDEYELGYRGEYAYPLELFVPECFEVVDIAREHVIGAAEAARRLGDLYEIPARVGSTTPLLVAA